jgi:hypothetical protein
MYEAVARDRGCPHPPERAPTAAGGERAAALIAIIEASP